MIYIYFCRKKTSNEGIYIHSTIYQGHKKRSKVDFLSRRDAQYANQLSQHTIPSAKAKDIKHDLRQQINSHLIHTRASSVLTNSAMSLSLLAIHKYGELLDGQTNIPTLEVFVRAEIYWYLSNNAGFYCRITESHILSSIYLIWICCPETCRGAICVKQKAGINVKCVNLFRLEKESCYRFPREHAAVQSRHL